MNEAQLRIRIQENSKKAVAKIKRNFQKIDRSRLRAKLNIDDSDIDKTRTKLEVLSKDRRVKVKTVADKKALAKTKAQLAGIEGVDASSRRFRNVPGSDTRGAIDGSTWDITKVEVDELSFANASSADGWNRASDGTLRRPDGAFAAQPENNRPNKNIPGGLVTETHKDLNDDIAKQKVKQVKKLKEQNRVGFPKLSDYDTYSPSSRERDMANLRGSKYGMLSGNVPGRAGSVQRRLRSGDGLNVGGFGAGTNVALAKKKAEGFVPLSERDAPMFGPRQAGVSDFTSGSDGLYYGSQNTKRGFQKSRNASDKTVGRMKRVGHRAPSKKRDLSPDGLIGPKPAQGMEVFENKVTKTKRTVSGFFGGMTDQVNNNRTKVKDLGNAFRAFGDKVRSTIPGMRVWHQILGASIPMLVGLGAQALAVASAFGAIAGAGALMVGGGLFGMGENLAEGMGHAERKLNRLKREMFQAFKPVLEIFEPISSEFFAMLPQRIAPLVEALKGITVFEDGFIRMFDGAIGWAAGVIEASQKYAETLESLVMNYGSELSTRLGDFMVFLIKTAKENQDVFFKLMDVFTAFVNIIWQVIKVGIYMAAVLSPIITLASKLATVLSNKLTVTLIAMVASFWMVSAAITSAIAGLQMFGGLAAVFSGAGLMKVLGGIAGMFTFVASEIWAAIVAMETWKALATFGASLLVGGVVYKSLQNEAESAQSGGGSGSSTHNTEINVYGKDAKEAGQRLEERFPDLYEQEMGRRSSRSMN